MQANWVFDEFFAKHEVWDSVFKPSGVACRPVLYSRGAELKTVVQLAPSGEVGIVTTGLDSKGAACAKCGRTKYPHVSRGPFPAVANEQASEMVKTKEYFGSGAAADKCVLISHTVASALITQKIRGVSLIPVES